MDTGKHISVRRALAIFGCVALLYLAAGGAYLHQHSGGPDTVCHVCQSLHAPGLAAAPLQLLPGVPQVAWHAVPPVKAVPLDSFSLHRASRAPPSA